MSQSRLPARKVQRFAIGEVADEQVAMLSADLLPWWTMAMRPWVRPYDDPIRLVTGGLAGVGTGFGVVLAPVVVTLAGRGQLVAAVCIAGFMSVWLTFAWRLHRTALLVGPQGVRLRWLGLTRTVPWAAIRDFRTRSDGLSTRLVLDRTDGSTYGTPVQRVRHRRTSASAISDGGTWLLPAEYKSLLILLKARLAQEQATTPIARP